MKRICRTGWWIETSLALILVVTSPVSVQIRGGSHSPDSAVAVAYLRGRLPHLPKKQRMHLELTGDTLVLRWSEGEWRVPASEVTTVYVALSRHSAFPEVAGIGAATGSVKYRKLLLSLRFLDPDRDVRNGVFAVLAADLGFRDFLVRLAQVAGAKLVFESEEARLRVELP